MRCYPIELTCPVCGPIGHLAIGKISYRFESGEYCSGYSQDGYCADCNKMVLAEKFPSQLELEFQLERAFENDKATLARCHMELTSLRTGFMAAWLHSARIKDLEEQIASTRLRMSQQLLYAKICARRRESPRCCECGSANITSYGDRFRSLKLPDQSSVSTSIAHPPCGQYVSARKLEFALIGEPPLFELTPEGEPIP